MALSPKDIALTVSERGDAERLEKELDEKLKRVCPPIEGGSVQIVMNSSTTERIFGEVRNRYLKVGWKKVYLDSTSTGRTVTFGM